jgi:hypothetical protein
MLLVDEAGYSGNGVVGSYAADAGLSLLACLLLGGLLIRYTRRHALTVPPFVR